MPARETQELRHAMAICRLPRSRRTDDDLRLPNRFIFIAENVRRHQYTCPKGMSGLRRRVGFPLEKKIKLSGAISTTMLPRGQMRAQGWLAHAHRNASIAIRANCAPQARRFAAVAGYEARAVASVTERRSLAGRLGSSVVNSLEGRSFKFDARNRVDSSEKVPWGLYRGCAGPHAFALLRRPS